MSPQTQVRYDFYWYLMDFGRGEAWNGRMSKEDSLAKGGGYYVLQHGNRTLHDSWNLGDLEKI